MIVTVQIDTANADFENQAGREVARILRTAANKVEDWPGTNEFTIGLRSVNGIEVGEVEAKRRTW